jgi:hypothetical protein
VGGSAADLDLALTKSELEVRDSLLKEERPEFDAVKRENLRQALNRIDAGLEPGSAEGGTVALAGPKTTAWSASMGTDQIEMHHMTAEDRLAGKMAITLQPPQAVEALSRMDEPYPHVSRTISMPKEATASLDIRDDDISEVDMIAELAEWHSDNDSDKTSSASGDDSNGSDEDAPRNERRLGQTAMKHSAQAAKMAKKLAKERETDAAAMPVSSRAESSRQDRKNVAMAADAEAAAAAYGQVSTPGVTSRSVNSASNTARGKSERGAI